jgi:hypothetical protein
MEDVESAKPEEPKSEPSAEDDTKPKEDATKPDSKLVEDIAEENAKPVDGPSKPAGDNAKLDDEPVKNSSAMEVDTADDFVVVEGGGQGDELAQEKATVKKSNEKAVSAGARLSNDVSVAGMKGTMTLLSGIY